MHKLLLIGSLFCFATVAFAEISEKIQKKVDAAELAFKAAVEKADNARFYAVQKATVDKVKVLKQAMIEATKSGDLDGGVKLKELIAAIELGDVKSRPKNVVKFGGHEYALLEKPATWHVAKKICEEMGGHLATFEVPGEQDFVRQLCGKLGTWVGASDEITEGEWKWVTGAPVPTQLQQTWVMENKYEGEHALAFWAPSNQWEDAVDSVRFAYICEWDK